MQLTNEQLREKIAEAATLAAQRSTVKVTFRRTRTLVSGEKIESAFDLDAEGPEATTKAFGQNIMLMIKAVSGSLPQGSYLGR